MTLVALEREGRQLGAVRELLEERAEGEARAADRDRRRNAGPAPLLLGIPYGAKDAIAARGAATTWGAPPYRRQVLSVDATVVRRLRKSGAVLAAKLSLIELAGAGLYSSAEASIDGPCQNPWDRSCWSGGSSSGSAAAVAARLLPYALGTETRGSTVGPAAYCGITGFRPTYGVLSRNGIMTAAWSMDKVGLLTLDARDALIVLAALTGRDSLDPTTLDLPSARRSKRMLKLGVIEQDLREHRSTAARFEEALQVLNRAAFRMKRVRLPPHNYLELSQTIVAAETAAAHESLIRSKDLEELLDRDQKAGLRSYLAQPGVVYVRALEKRIEVTAAIDGLFADVDFLVAPTLPMEAPRLDADVRAGPRIGLSALGALCGVPAVTVPMGFGDRGLPLGLTFIGPRLRDIALLRAAAKYQQVTNWHRIRPPDPTKTRVASVRLTQPSTPG